MSRRDEPSRRVDLPEPGWFKLRLVKGGPYVPAAITRDGGAWGAIINGIRSEPTDADPARATDVFRVWHSGMRIDAAEYRHMLAVSHWAKDHAPDDPAADPTKPIALARRPSVF
ncbi:MAG: hypothetical protein ACEQSH_00355 [Bacteroidia bacterium]